MDINLSSAKERVFEEIFRVLKPGGELYFSDVFANCRISESLAADPVLRGECISGALYVEDFRRIMAAAGWKENDRNAYRLRIAGLFLICIDFA